MVKKPLFSVFFIIIISFPAFSQDSTTIAPDLVGVLLRREESGCLLLHSNGWGAGYRFGKNITWYKKRIYGFEFATMKHPKETKIRNPYYFNSKSYIYGKLNYVFLFRGDIGTQHVLFAKPNWGGVAVRYFYSGGISLALLKPVYLYVLTDNASTYEYDLSTEKYDPHLHYLNNIYGRAPFTKGINEIGIRPGACVKGGFNFEYGPYMEKLRTLEVGAVLDFFPKPIEMMAFNDPNYFFLSIYFSFHFGKRYNKFD